MFSIDLNCDMGEGMTTDEQLIPFITSANIACGFHAGDEHTILSTLELSAKYNVAAGAHPGFDDKANFGRVPVYLAENALYTLVQRQLEIMQKCCERVGVKLHHVKPHGALYNMAAMDARMSNIIAKAVADFNPDLVYVGLSGSVMLREAEAMGLKIVHEVFADRTYQPDGTLTPRSHPRALIHSSKESIQQVLQMIKSGTVNTLEGTPIAIKAQTVCIHGDGAHAVTFARTINETLKQEGIILKAIA